MLVKPARPSNLAPLTSEESLAVRNHIFEALRLVPRHQHRGKAPTDCNNCILLNHLVTAFSMFKRIGE